MEYGCIGEKLQHSFSKEIHARLADYSYELCEIPKDELSKFMQKKDFRAINVTIPYKTAVIPYLDEISETAKKIGAVNTIVNRGGRLYGYNTDFFGMQSLITENGISLKNKKVLILGTGGTSKTAHAVAEDLGAREILTVSRSEKDGTVSYDEAYRLHDDAAVIINTTPAGMFPKIDAEAIDPARFTELRAVVDAVYNPLKTTLSLNAQSCGVKAVCGLYMLVAQAAFAVEKFIDKKIEKDKIKAVYADILRQKQNLVLIGMPGCGKTTIGNLLAEKLDRPFYDTDKLIEKRAQKSIPEIFAAEGETHFRALERDVIKTEVAPLSGAVIATGGGAVLNPQNIFELQKNGMLVFLDRKLDALAATKDRPLSSTRAAVEKLYSERYPIYKDAADIHLNLGDDPIENTRRVLAAFKGENL